jgi:D-alanyl-D-alanine dipeptidase
MITQATENVIYPAIPLHAGQVDGWKNIPIRAEDVQDSLVPLGLLSREAAAIATSAIYFGEHANSPYAKDINKIAGSLLTLFARQSAARRLLRAEHLLPARHHLLIFDAYRPYQVQKSLYDFYEQKLREKHPDMDHAAAEVETQKYVSLPSLDPSRPSPHNTGGAIDATVVVLSQAHEAQLLHIRSQLTDPTLKTAQRTSLELQLAAIMSSHATMLDFGTAFDHGGEKSALAYYEAKIAAGETLTDAALHARNNRRLLYGVMMQAGFQPYFAEWWHFNAPESQMGAAAAGINYASFGAAGLSASNTAHEQARLALRQEAFDVQNAGGSGDAALADNWPVEIIAPPEV